MNHPILIAVVGRTDPIRDEHDGPILHITRYYKPERIILILSEELGELEKKYHYMKDAIHLLDEKCMVDCIYTGIVDVHSYDDFSMVLMQVCNEAKEKYKESRIILDITSGTPQMETGLCMIALSDTERYLPIQVSTPAKAGNKSGFFNPEKDDITMWFETDLDNEENICRCMEPQLFNYRRPIIQFQIRSLIQHYDYAGALQLIDLYKKSFSECAHDLILHAKNRLMLRNEDARKNAKALGMERELYSVKQKRISELVEYYNAMHVKQKRGELNDFALRMEILTEYLAIYLIEECMGFPRASFCNITSKICKLDKEKAQKVFPGIDAFLDEIYIKEIGRGFDWNNKALSGRIASQIAAFLVKKEEHQKYQVCVEEFLKWIKISADVRNLAAHTMVAVTEDMMKSAYENLDSAALCKRIQRVMLLCFESGIDEKVFQIYDTINEKIAVELEKSV